MANNSINDLAFLNQIITKTDDIRMSLSQVTALMRVASDESFIKHSETTIELYLSVVSDLVDDSRQLSHLLLQSLKETRKNNRIES